MASCVHLEGETSGMRLMADRDWWRPADIDHDGRFPSCEAAIAGLVSKGNRRSANIVMDHERRQCLHRHMSQSVESRETGRAEPEKAQHRHHAVDGAEKFRWRVLISCDVALPQRQ